jgi:hypothetical protein
MGERGIVHLFHPTWTEPDPDNPGKRRRRIASTWAWRFEWRKKKYGRADSYKTKAEARDAGQKRMAQVRAGLEEDPLKVGFAVLDRILIAEAELQVPSTKHATLTALARLRLFFAGDRLAEIKRPRLIEYVAHQRARGRQDSTTRQDLRALKHAMDLAHEEGLMIAIPRFPTLKVRSRQQTIPPHELDAIVDELPEHWVRYYIIADEIGWRARSEIKTRKWTDVEWGPPSWECGCPPPAWRGTEVCPLCGHGRPGFVHLDAEHSKTGKPRSFPLTVRLRALLVEQRMWIEKVQQQTGQVIPWIFCKPTGEPLGDTRKAWRSACNRAGLGERIEGRTGPWSFAKVPHDIRRTVIRRWKAMGEPIDVRMAAAGHDSTETHMAYEGGDPESLQAFGERIDERRRKDAERVVAIRKA